MNVYEKLQAARVALQQKAIPKSGQNKHAGYTYHELSDFLPHINQILCDHKLCSIVSFSHEVATLTIVNAEKPDETITFTSPMAEASLRGVQPIQNVGAVQTYQRRYLYMMALEIVEHDALDASAQDENRNGQARATNGEAPRSNSSSVPASQPNDEFTDRLKAAVSTSSQEEVAAQAGVSLSSVAKAASGLDIPEDDRRKLEAFLMGTPDGVPGYEAGTDYAGAHPGGKEFEQGALV